MAHNGGCFDTLFILCWFLTKSSIVPNVVMNGNKIMSMKIVNISVG